MDTFNKFGVGVMGNNIVIALPKPKLTYDEAILLSVYLKLLAEPFASAKFDELEKEVRNT